MDCGDYVKKQSLLKGTFILGVAGIFAKFLGFFFRWPLQILIGDEGIGYYQMSYPLYMFFVAVASGVPIAISKMVSEKSALGDKEGIILVIRKSLIFMITMGLGFSLLIIVFSKNIIAFLKWDDKAYYSLISIALAPFFISIMCAFRGFFQGLQNMNYTAISQIIEQLGRVIFGVGLAYLLLPKGIEYAAGGAAIGAAAGGVLGSIYMILKYLKIRKTINVGRVKNDLTVMSKLLYIAIPISLGAAAGTIMNLIDSILVPQKLLEAGYNYKQATIIYGQLTGKAAILINLPLTLSAALSVSLVPIIAEKFILNNRKELVSKVDLAIRACMVVAIPSMMGLFFMAYPILNLIFPGQVGGYKILKYLSISIPFIILAQASTAILQGLGRFIRPVINLVIGCGVKTICTYFLVSSKFINVYGAVIGTILGYIVTTILNMRLLKKTLNIKIEYYNVIIKPGYASAIMMLAVILIYTGIYNKTMSLNIACIVAIFAGIIIYSILLLLFGIFNYKYIKRNIYKK